MRRSDLPQHHPSLLLPEVPADSQQGVKAYLYFLREVACCLAHRRRGRLRLVLSARVSFVHYHQGSRAHSPGT